MDIFGPALRWMSFEAVLAGVRLTAAQQTWQTEQLVHNSLSPIWWPFELMPFHRLSYDGSDAVTTRCVALLRGGAVCSCVKAEHVSSETDPARANGPRDRVYRQPAHSIYCATTIPAAADAWAF